MATRKINFPVTRLKCILDLLFEEIRGLSNENREQSIEWSTNHLYSCSQLAKLLAAKRGLDPEIAAIAGAIHDIAIIKTGRFENHGPKGEEPIKDLINRYNSDFGEKYGLINNKEIEIIVSASVHHSEKTIFTDDKYIELIKDVDSLDRFLHGKDTYAHNKERSKRALEDLNLDFSDFI